MFRHLTVKIMLLPEPPGLRYFLSVMSGVWGQKVFLMKFQTFPDIT